MSVDCKECFSFSKVGRITRCAHDGFKIKRVNCEVPFCAFSYTLDDVKNGLNGIERITSLVVFDYKLGKHLMRRC